ncbi:HtaA domain-containing protein [Dermabacteraceae bacterium P13136]
MNTTSFKGRSLTGLVGAFALFASGFALTVPAAHAESAPVNDATFSWRMSDEAGGGAYFGGCNFITAGAVGNTGKSKVWKQEDADKWYKTAEGNVTITTPNGTPTWDTKCLDESGKKVTTRAGSTTGAKVNFSKGKGTVDVAANTADITWEGSASVVFYGGMTYWSFSNPHLVINSDGTGSITATGSGYASSMADTSKWEKLPDEQIVLANFKDAKVTETGFTATPLFKGVEVDIDTKKGMAQSRKGEGWGSFPQEFVNFQLKTGQSSYWYSSGGAADPKKVAAPVTLSWSAPEAAPAEPPAADKDEEKDATKVNISVNVPEATQPDPGTGDGTAPGDGSGDGGTKPGEGEGTPDPEPAGEFTYTVSSTSADLGTATENAAGFAAAGALPTITVKDTRKDAPAFTVNGKASDFTGTAGTIPAASLGWAPSLADNTVGAVEGAPVEANNPGLAEAKSLVSAPAGHAKGEVKVNTKLTFQAPKIAPAGQYSSVLTVTAIS